MKATVYYVLLGLGCVAVSLLTFLAVAGPSDYVRDKIIEAIRSQTGREVAVQGGSSFKFFPNFGVSLSDVVVSQPAGMSASRDHQPFLNVATIDIAVPLLPLLRRQVKVERLVLKRPVLELRVDAQGRRNWDFGPPGQRASLTGGTPVQVAAMTNGQRRSDAADDLGDLVRRTAAPAVVSTAADPAGLPLALDDLQLNDVRIENGVVHFRDEQSGAREDLTAIDLLLSLESLDAKLGVRGAVVWHQEKTGIDGWIAAPRDLIAGKPSKLAIKLAARPVETLLDGTLALRPDAQFTGTLNATSKSARALAAWFGRDLPAGAGMGPMAITGQLGASGQRLDFKDAVIQLDGATARGDISVEPGAQRPMVRANLKFDKLDLNLYRGGQASRPPAQPAAPGQKSLTDLIKDVSPDSALGKRQPEVRGWSSAALDFSAFGLLDGQALLDVGQLVLGDIVLDRTVLDARVQDRVLTAGFKQVALYRGQGSGEVVLDASTGTTATLAARFSLAGVEAQPLLKAAAGFDRIAGKGRLDVNVRAAGTNQQQMLEALNGTAKIAFADGAVIGVNIPQMIRSIQQGNFSGGPGADSEKTDFSEITGTFTITNGAAQTQDLRLNSPFLRVTGTGTIDLAHQSLDLSTRPKLVASAAGQGGIPGLAGLEIPVTIKGPWDKPQVAADLAGVLKDPAQLQKGIQELGDAVLKGKSGKDVENALRGLLGGR